MRSIRSINDGGSCWCRMGPGFKSSGRSSGIEKMSVSEDSNLRLLLHFRNRIALEPRSMPVPDFQTFLLPLLRLTADGKEHPLRDLRMPMQAAMALSDEDLTERLPSG